MKKPKVSRAPRYVCPDCKYRTDDYTDYMIHIKTHGKKDE